MRSIALSCIRGNGVRPHFLPKLNSRDAACELTKWGLTPFLFFANVSLGELKLLLSGREASGSRPVPDGRLQEAGGSNRIVLRVADLQGFIHALKQSKLSFRNQIESGPGGSQIQLEDPDGNPIELFEAAQPH